MRRFSFFLCILSCFFCILSQNEAFSEYANDGYGRNGTGWFGFETLTGSDWFETNTLIGESVGEGMYSKVDKNTYSAIMGIYTQSIQLSAEDLNRRLELRTPSDEIGKNGRLARFFPDGVCSEKDPCDRVFVKNLNLTALDEIKDGIFNTEGGLLPALDRRITQDAQGNTRSFSTTTIGELMEVAQKYAQEKEQHIQRSVENLQQLSTIGLYIDGDTDNSDYDIIDDIEKINKRLFKEPVTYSGPENRSKDSLRDLYAGPIQASPLPSGGTEITSTGFVYKDISAENCATPAFWASLVHEINTLLNPSEAYEKLSQDPLLRAGLATHTQIGVPRVQGICPNNEIFCISIDFLSYEQKLFGYGNRTTSIQNVIDKHLAHIEKNAGKSFVQSKNATSFGELGFDTKNIKSFMIDNLSFGIDINYLPPQFLASKGYPRKEDDLSQSGKISDDIINAMKNAGFGQDPLKWNSLFRESADTQERVITANGEGTSSTKVGKDAQKSNEKEQTNLEISSLEMAGIQDAGLKSFANHILEISSFTNAFQGSIGKLTDIVQKMAKPTP